MSKVKIYTQEGCGHCKEVKEFFKENDIEFEEIDAGGKDAIVFLKEIKAEFLPVTVIGDRVVEGPEIGYIEAQRAKALG